MFYREGSLFKAISPSHLLSVFMAVAGLGFLFKPKKKQFWIFSVDTFIILEALGSVTYICTDKTGTFIQNKMQVEK